MSRVTNSWSLLRVSKTGKLTLAFLLRSREATTLPSTRICMQDIGFQLGKCRLLVWYRFSVWSCRVSVWRHGFWVWCEPFWVKDHSNRQQRKHTGSVLLRLKSLSYPGICLCKLQQISHDSHTAHIETETKLQIRRSPRRSHANQTLLAMQDAQVDIVIHLGAFLGRVMHTRMLHSHTRLHTCPSIPLQMRQLPSHSHAN